MHDKGTATAESTAVRVALWRALHVQVDPPPHVFEDEIGLKLLSPDKDWRRRADMDPQFTRPFRASIVARARFIEDLVEEQAVRALLNMSSSAPALTALPSESQRSRPASNYLRSTGRVLRRGNAGADRARLRCPGLATFCPDRFRGGRLPGGTDS